jgi:hypothetical protein
VKIPLTEASMQLFFPPSLELAYVQKLGDQVCCGSTFEAHRISTV